VRRAIARPQMFVIALNILCMLLLGCNRSGPAVQFILPEGFRGIFQVSFDKQHGRTVTESNGVLIIEVPTNAIALVGRDEFLTRWHQVSASYPSGTVYSSEAFDTNSIALYTLASSGHTYWWMLTYQFMAVTSKEWRHIKNSFWVYAFQ
jgi:hypothetical protein